MKYNFDQIIDRHNTNSLKFDFALQRKRPQDAIPLWVADMDLQTLVDLGRFLYIPYGNYYYQLFA